jgi:hypothetical protein
MFLNPLVKFVLTTAVLLLSHEQASADTAWAYCYNQKQNRIYFQTAQEIKKHKGACLSRTYYQGLKNFELIEDDLDANGFPVGAKGTSLNMILDSGRNILVSHWTNLTKNNTLIVLEPDFTNNQVKVHCTYKNFSNDVKARVDKKDGVFKVLIRQPYPEKSENYITRWQNCPLNK